MEPRDPRWEEAEVVAEFAAREPDLRLVALLDSVESSQNLVVLDLGCAAGRNTVLLAQKGCDVIAVDLSHAMVEETRRRLVAIMGAEEATRRVVRAAMDDLSFLRDESFDLIVALGVYHQAASVEEWVRAIRESLRLLRPRGRLLVALFAPGTDLTGSDGGRIEGEEHVYWIREGSPAVLFDAAELDRRMSTFGLVHIEETSTVEKPHQPAGRRVTVNALYRKT